jgi:hypothetical protein
LGVAGVCWDVQLVSLKTSLSESSFYLDPEAIELAIYHAHVVTGVAALVLAQNPTYTPAQIKSRILNSVDEVDALDGYCVTGGRLNAFNALHSHSYTYRYVSLGQSGHNAYCSCGDYVVDTHLFVTSGGGTRCSKCNYRLN